MTQEDRIPEDARNLADPFWQVVFAAWTAEVDACDRKLIAQKQRDDEWYSRTWKRLEDEGLLGTAFNDAIKEEMRTYVTQNRVRCVGGEHRLR